MVQREYNSGSLTQRGYLFVGVCQGKWVLTGGPLTGKKPSAELSPWSSLEVVVLGHHGRLQGFLVGK